MGKNMRLPALLAAGMLLLSGCGLKRESDLSQREPEFFRHTLGEGYQWKFKERTKPDSSDSDTIWYERDWYTYEYTGADGETHSGEYPLESYSDYLAARDPSEEAYSEEAFYASQKNDLVRFLLDRQFDSALRRQYFMPNIPDALKLTRGSYYAGLYPICFYEVEGAAGEAVRSLADTEKGLQFGTATLESVVQDDRLYTVAAVTLNASEDAAEDISGFQKLAEEFRVLNPQNYFFLLKQKESDADDAAEHVLFYEYAMYGEVTEYDPETAPAYEYAFQYLDALCEAYPAK